MTLTTIAVNGVALADYGLVPLNLTEWASAPAVTYQSLNIVGRMGSLPTTRGIVYPPRVLQLGIKADAGSMAASRSLLGAWYLAAQGTVELEMIDQPGRVCYGYFTASPTANFGVTLLSTNYQSIGTITCFDSFWHDRSPVSFGAASTERIVVPVGTAPTRLLLSLCGPYTNPTLTLRNRSGVSLATMRFTDTIADGTVFLNLDFNLMQADRWVSGVRSGVNNAYPLLNVNDAFFAVDPLDAPTLDASSGYLSGLAWRGYLV